MQNVGSIVNTFIVIAAAEGLFLCRNHSLLVQYGGNLQFDKPWGKSLFIQMGFVKRNATNARKILSAEVEYLKSNFLDHIKSAGRESSSV